MCCAGHAQDIRVTFPPCPKQPGVYGAFSRDWLEPGRIKELGAGRAQGTCKAPSSPDVQGQSRDSPSPVPAAKGSGLEGQAADLAFPEPVLAVLQGVVHLISAWHLHVFSQLSLLGQKCENLKEME